MMDSVWVWYMQIWSLRLWASVLRETLWTIRTRQRMGRTTRGSCPYVLPGTSYETQWPSFLTRVVIKVERTENLQEAAVTERKLVRRSFVFPGSLSQWRGVGSDFKMRGRWEDAISRPLWFKHFRTHSAHCSSVCEVCELVCSDRKSSSSIHRQLESLNLLTQLFL